MFFVYSSNPIRRKSFRNSNQCRPQPAVNESYLSIHQPTHQHLIRISYCLQDSEDLAAVWMSPPATFDRLAGDRLCQSRNRPFGRSENHSMFPHKSYSLFYVHRTSSISLVRISLHRFERSAACSKSISPSLVAIQVVRKHGLNRT